MKWVLIVTNESLSWIFFVFCRIENKIYMDMFNGVLLILISAGWITHLVSQNVFCAVNLKMQETVQHLRDWDQNQNDAHKSLFKSEASAQPHLFSQTHKEIQFFTCQDRKLQATWCVSVHVWNNCELTFPE